MKLRMFQASLWGFKGTSVDLNFRAVVGFYYFIRQMELQTIFGIDECPLYMQYTPDPL